MSREDSTAPSPRTGFYSPLVSPSCPANQMTPTAMGNLKGFGWRPVGNKTSGADEGHVPPRSESSLSEPSTLGGSGWGQRESPIGWKAPSSPSSKRPTPLPSHLRIEVDHGSPASRRAVGDNVRGGWDGQGAFSPSETSSTPGM